MKRFVAVFASLVFAVSAVQASANILFRESYVRPPTVVYTFAEGEGLTVTGGLLVTNFTWDECADYGGVTQRDGSCRGEYNLHIGPNDSRCHLNFEPKTTKNNDGLWQPKIVCTWKPQTKENQ